MKKLISLSLLLVAQYAFSYIPASGPLQLSDSCLSSSSEFKVRGEIIKSLQQNLNLHTSLQALCRFDGAQSVDELSSYQEIMHKLSNLEFSTIESDQAIEAIEYAIMYAYDKQVYILGGYTKYGSVLFSGIRWRALNPFSYLNPWSWCTENHEKASQLVCEFKQLVDIAYKIKSVHCHRLYATLVSYKYWRLARLAPLLLVMLKASGAANNNVTFSHYNTF